MLLATLFADIQDHPWALPVIVVLVIVAIWIELRKASAPKINVRSQRHVWFR